jgi:hypothetical protein
MVPLISDAAAPVVLGLRKALVDDYITRLMMSANLTKAEVMDMDQKTHGVYINNMFSKSVNNEVKRLFKSESEYCKENGITFGSHFLRALWVNVHAHNERLNPDAPSKTLLISILLGHEPDSMASAKYYECIEIIPEFELLPAKSKAKKPAQRRKAPTKKASEMEGGTIESCMALPAAKKRAPAKRKAAESDTEYNVASKTRLTSKQKSRPMSRVGETIEQNSIFYDVDGKPTKHQITYQRSDIGTLEHACTMVTSLMESGIAPNSENLLALKVDLSLMSNGDSEAVQKHFISECNRLERDDWGLDEE